MLTTPGLSANEPGRGRSNPGIFAFLFAYTKRRCSPSQAAVPQRWVDIAISAQIADILPVMGDMTGAWVGRGRLERVVESELEWAAHATPGGNPHEPPIAATHDVGHCGHVASNVRTDNDRFTGWPVMPFSCRVPLSLAGG